VLPTVILTAVNDAGQTVNTTVSSNEAVFVTGVFSQQVFVSEFGIAAINVAEAERGLHNGTIAFVLPGVSIMVYPIGGIVTGTWFLVGLAVMGFTTYERYGHRESYRRRKARAGGKAAAGTI
jgi:hypothetical protein